MRYIKDRLRRSMMFVPGNNPGMIRDAHIYGADSIMFDLEDSVAYTEKDAARLLVYNALRSLNFGSRETVVRINDLSSGLGIEDLEAVVRAGVQVVRLPKTDSAQDVIDCEREIARIERESGIPVGTTGMMAAIESANGVLNAAEIARASNRLIGIALGAEDYVTDLKTTRSDGIELLFARCMILNAARAAGIAGAAEFIAKKQGGYHDPIAQGGSNLSGGQRQRMAIARALIKRPEIYVFDDSFSALDMKTDQTLRQNLKESMGEAAVILVAQRVSTILDADRILVVDDGRIVGQGTHGELLRTCPLYREIAEIQLGKEAV